MLHLKYCRSFADAAVENPKTILLYTKIRSTRLPFHGSHALRLQFEVTVWARIGFAEIHSFIHSFAVPDQNSQHPTVENSEK